MGFVSWRFWCLVDGIDGSGFFVDVYDGILGWYIINVVFDCIGDYVWCWCVYSLLYF